MESCSTYSIWLTQDISFTYFSINDEPCDFSFFLTGIRKSGSRVLRSSRATKECRLRSGSHPHWERRWRRRTRISKQSFQQKTTSLTLSVRFTGSSRLTKAGITGSFPIHCEVQHGCRPAVAALSCFLTHLLKNTFTKFHSFLEPLNLFIYFLHRCLVQLLFISFLSLPFIATMTSN